MRRWPRTRTHRAHTIRGRSEATRSPCVDTYARTFCIDDGVAEISAMSSSSAISSSSAQQKIDLPVHGIAWYCYAWLLVRFFAFSLYYLDRGSKRLVNGGGDCSLYVCTRLEDWTRRDETTLHYLRCLTYSSLLHVELGRRGVCVSLSLRCDD